MKTLVRGLAVALFLGSPLPALAVDSVCYGTPGKGRLEGGVRLAVSGDNFRPYSRLGVELGRTHVHADVEKTVTQAYALLARSWPDKTFVYGETGWKTGGPIPPHRTHQNGLAVDFMVPVVDAKGRSVPLPTDAADKFGYAIEFDKRARYGELAIDFEAMAAHLHALHVAAREHGVGIGRVIFEPAFIPRLYATREGDFIRRNIRFMQGQAWVRHDEHYHVDFVVPCRPL